MSKILAVLLTSLVFTGTALADDDARADDQAVEDIEGQSRSKSKARQSGSVREVVRGFYIKANVGTLAFVGARANRGLLSPGTALSLNFGQDFIDKEKTSAAWEVFFHQSMNNGAKYFEQNMVQAPPDLRAQGDIHTFTFGAAGEYSTYLSKRLGLGLRAGGGVGWAPLLMDENQYREQVLPQWGSQPAEVHDRPLFLVFAGPTLEYYTKLSHFSVGIDTQFSVYIGLDMGIDASGFLKYTF
jgi:hypothetical protein